jgi:hypothetical protein
VARLAQQLPQVLDELGSGAIHLTGLFLLSQRLTPDNAEGLLAEARGKSRREIELLLARWFPRPDVPERIQAAPASPAEPTVTRPETGSSAPAPDHQKVQPLSDTTYRVELTISAELHAKIEQLKNLVSHAVPSGNLAQLLERAVDALIERETRRRSGAGRPRTRRPQKLGSRHVPVDVERAVRERDGNQCTFTDEYGRRCSEKRFLTIEHDIPYAFGGRATVANCRMLCASHNAHTARRVFGEGHIENKIAEAKQVEERRPDRGPASPPKAAAVQGPVYDQVLSALVSMGFRRELSRRALAALPPDAEPRVEPMLRAALAALTPA